jgi:muramoyltetrapeptide carboxypeptidase
MFKMKLLKPPRLSVGDTVGIVAPSHPVLPFQSMYLKGVENLKKLGFRVKEGKTVKLQHSGYMAGTDAQRAEDINSMFADEEVKAIICAMGGQVAIRTLRYLDFDLIRANPKIFSGMSDITTFHVAFLAKTGLVGLHQTDVVFGFEADAHSKEAKYEMDLFFKVTENAEPLGLLPAFTRWEVWREGKAEGRLFGGNVPSLQALLATPYFPKLDEDIIFFWECMTQPLDLLDQRLVQFREAGLFDRVKGMLIGKIRGEDAGVIRDMTGEVEKVVLDITDEFDFPIIASMDFGHYTPNLPLPTWLKASMNTERARVWINESYVK